MDLYKLYKSVFNKLCPEAVITADRFHVTKLLHQELNQGRKVLDTFLVEKRCQNLLRIDQKKTALELEIEPSSSTIFES